MFDKRSEGNYNKQENSSKTKGNKPGFWENLKALVSESNRSKERECLDDKKTSPLPLSAEHEKDITDEVFDAVVFNTTNEVEEAGQSEQAKETKQQASTHIDDEDSDADSIVSTIRSSNGQGLDYIDFYTETSETDIYSMAFRHSDSTDSIDSSEAGFYVETSDMHFYIPALEEKIAKHSPAMPDLGTTHANDGPKGPKSLSAFLLCLLACIIGPYIGIFIIFTIPQLDKPARKYDAAEAYRQEQEQRLREEAIEEERERRQKAQEQERYKSFYNKDTRTLTLPKSEFAGNEYAFAAQDAKTIRSAGVVSTIGDNAFCSYQELETVNIKCKIVGIESFKGCASLRTAIITRNLNWLRSEAFANCPRLETVLLSTTLSQIEDNVFMNSNNIREISIPNNVKTHFFQHLSHCRKINTIYLLSLDYFKMPKSIKDAPIQFSKCKLYVPDSKLEQFRKNADWARFGQILPLSQSRWFDEKGWGK